MNAKQEARALQKQGMEYLTSSAEEVPEEVTFKLKLEE